MDSTCVNKYRKIQYEQTDKNGGRVQRSGIHQGNDNVSPMKKDMRANY